MILKLFYQKFESEFIQITEDLSAEFPVKNIQQKSIDDWEYNVENAESKDHYYAIRLYDFYLVPQQKGGKAEFNVSAGFKGPKSSINVNIPEGFLPFWIQYQLNSHDANVRNAKGLVNRIVINKSGEVYMYDEGFSKRLATGLDEITKATDAILKDEELWRMLYET
ncbi:MAG: hypothetical protein HRT57_00350 [Crocinitomicaceae bacterium]|nr:hypothetical protein [Crocinitomicaceae bacterium]